MKCKKSDGFQVLKESINNILVCVINLLVTTFLFKYINGVFNEISY